MNRLFKDGIVTTCIGFVLLGVSIYMFLSGNYTELEAGEILVIAMMFLRSKDSIINLQPKEEDVNDNPESL